jgi:Elongation factor G, domain IV
MYAALLPESIPAAIEDGTITPRDDPKVRVRALRGEHGMVEDSAKNIWCFGTDTTGANFLVDRATAVQYLQNIKDSCVAAFQWATKEGVLCNENVRGVVYNIHTCTVHPDAAHRGGAQIVPSCRRAIFGAHLSAAPRLLEPVYLVEIQCPEQTFSWLNIWRAGKKESSCDRRDAASRHTHFQSQGLSPRCRIVRFYRRPALGNFCPSFPAVRVRPLAGHSR